jgi:transposase
MSFIGLDVHCKSTHWTLMETAEEVIARGQVPTTVPGLEELLRKLGRQDLVAAQEAGTLCHLVHDTLSSLGVKILTFNAHHLRNICCSRSKTDRRDSYWLARSVASGMYPVPVYIPDVQIRDLRSLLQQRDGVVRERTRWLLRARSHLRMAGEAEVQKARQLPDKIEDLLSRGVSSELINVLQLCLRHIEPLEVDRDRLTALLEEKAGSLPAVIRLRTIPGVGLLTSIAIYAWVGDVSRFANARLLCAYAGLVPEVRNSGESNRMGRITKEGSKLLRQYLVEAANSLGSRCRRQEAQPLKDFKYRIVNRSGKKKVATVALARHILRIAYYVLRDETVYRPELLSNFDGEQARGV